MRYMIPVENIEELRKKANTIQKKAVKYGVTIVFEEIGEEYKTVKDEDGREIVRKYIEVEAEGEAKAEGWMFAGTIEHTEVGNILRSIDDEHKIPERYNDAEPYCEHCKTKRARKDTYVVFNEETGEYKQVGKTCLKEYTNGLSVEMAALVLQWMKEVETRMTFGGTSMTYYYDVKEISKYFAETMRKLGWAGSSYGDGSTKSRAIDFYRLDTGLHLFPKEKERIENLAKEIQFDINNIDDEYIESALAWAKGWDEHEYNDYRSNLKVIASMKYCEWKHLGYLASLYMAYDKEMEKEVKKARKAAEKAKSEYVGEVGKKYEAAVKSCKLLTSWETQWGYNFLYEFVTEDDNIIIWKASSIMWAEEENVVAVKGTVKAHSEYNGVKQTVLTRCRVTEKAVEETASTENYDALPESMSALDLLY